MTESCSHASTDALEPASRPCGDSVADALPASREPEILGLGSDVVGRTLEEFVTGADAFGSVGVERAEMLSILLHLIGDAQAPERSGAVATRLAQCLSAPLGADEFAVVVGWLRLVCANASPAEVDRQFAQVATALRARPGALADVMIQTCQRPHGVLAGAIWPYLALELITDDETPREAEKTTLAALVASVSRDRLGREATRLHALLTEPVTVTQSVFSPPRDQLYGLYDVVLAIPHERSFAAAVTAGFVHHPPKHPAAAALAVLKPDEERTHRFIARLVKESGTPSPTLTLLAAEILTDALRRLPKAQREEAWVAASVRALGRLPCPMSEELLGDVCGARRHLVRWAWPAAARQAAAEALADVRRRLRAAQGAR